jgi:nickel/cobalt transporter (NicO) family protein
LGFVFRLGAVVFWGVCLPSLAMGSASAHPLGNFTINHLVRIEPRARRLRVHYVLDIAEIPTFQIMHADGDWNAARMFAWQKAEAAVVSGALSIQANAVALPLHLEHTSARTRPGAGGLPTLYWTGDYTTPLVAKASFVVRDSVYADRRIGWKDIVLPGSSDPTNDLRAYPSALIGSPRQNDVATFDMLEGGRIARVGVSGDDAAGWAATSIVRSTALSDLIAHNGQTPLWILLTILAAFGLGALHGLEPGHGKALLAFTLVGARATLKQAAILAAALTFAHTIAVLLLGLVLFFAVGFATENLFTWITLISGVAVAAIGARSLAAAVAHARDHAAGNAHDHHHAHGHDHGHAHAIAGSEPLHFHSAVVAAMSGGIAPCPAAIVVLLTALHLHRVGYGLMLIVVFSLGLAAILSGLGFAVVRGAAWLQRQSGFARLAGFAPFVTAGVISIVGASMLAQGVSAQGFRTVAPAVAALVLCAIALVAFVPAFLSPRSTHRTLAIKETT